MRPLGGELVEKRPVERAPAGAEIAGDEGARRRAVGKAGVLQKAAVDEAGRLGRLRDRAHHARRPSESSLASWQVQHAARSRRVDSFCGSASEQERRSAMVMVANRDAVAPVGGAAGPQDRLVVLDRVLGYEPLRRRGRVEAGRSVAALGGARARSAEGGEESEGEEAREARRQAGSPLLDRRRSPIDDKAISGVCVRFYVRFAARRRGSPEPHRR